MSTVLERFYEDALSRVAIQKPISDEDLPRPNYPQHEGFDPATAATDNDYVFPIGQKWLVENVKTRMSLDRATTTLLNNQDRNLIDGGLRETGLDVLAFYKSRRYLDTRPYIGKWGIFYLDHGVNRIRELIEEIYPGYGSTLKMAYELIREHERFHFKFDLYALSAEAKTGRALYDPLKRAFRNHRIYQVEEALANLSVWEWSKKKHIGIEELVYDLMKLQPGAYNRFDEEKPSLAGELAANLLDLDFARFACREDQALWIGIIPDELQRRSLCPEYFVIPSSLSLWINPAFIMPVVKKIIENQAVAKLLEKKYASIKEQWEMKKRRLIEYPASSSLDFKPWDRKTGHWSVRINGNFRAHLRPLPESPETWVVDEIGSHKAMGHG